MSGEDRDALGATSREDCKLVAKLDNVQVAIVGTGLIGASVGLAAKRAGVRRVTGFDADPEALAAAADRGAVESPAGSLEDAVAGAELVVVATPVSVISSCVAESLAAASAGCAVTDVGSTKTRICR